MRLLATQMRDSGQMAAGPSLRLPSARRWTRGTGRNRRGRRETAEVLGRSFVQVTTNGGDQVGMGRDPRGDGGATCKIAGIAYTGSNPVPATLPLTCENAALSRGVMPGSRVAFPSGFPPPDAPPTPPANPALLGRTRPRSPRRAGARSGELVDVDPLGEGAAVGVAELGGDNAGRLLVGRHCRGQRMPQHVRMGHQPDAGG